MSARLALALLASLLVACARPAPTRAPADPNAQTIAALEKLHAARPDDASVVFLLAVYEDEGGRPEGALKWLQQLKQLGWDYPPGPRDFLKTRGHPGFAEIAAEFARREPKVLRAELAFTLAERDMFPEGIAFDPVDRVFYLGRGIRRGVVRVARDGTPGEFVADRAGELLAPLGMKVDASARVLWVASTDLKSMAGHTAALEGASRLVAFDLTSGTARASLPLGGPKQPSLLNDIALAPDGRVFVTDSLGGGVWTADLQATGLRALVPAKTFEYPNGIAASPDGKTLYVADFFGLSAVDAGSGAVQKLTPPKGTFLGAIDGLSLYEGRLVGIQNALGAARVWSVAVGPQGLSDATIVLSGDTRLDTPTTGAVAEGALWLIANPQIFTVDPEGLPLPRDQYVDLLMLRVPLSE